MKIFAVHFSILLKPRRNRGSSVSVVSDYGLDERTIRVRSPAWAKEFSSILCIQTGSQAYPASCTMGTGGPSPGAKHGRGVTLTTHPHLVPRSRISWSYSSSPLWHLHGAAEQVLLYLSCPQNILCSFLYAREKFQTHARKTGNSMLLYILSFTFWTAA
jgi:hypothetical protein